MLLRITSSFILLLSVLFMPIWVSMLLALAGMVYFPMFLEGVFLLLLSDLLFGTRADRFYHITYLTFLMGSVVLIIVESLKKKLKFYP